MPVLGMIEEGAPRHDLVMPPSAPAPQNEKRHTHTQTPKHRQTQPSRDSDFKWILNNDSQYPKTPKKTRYGICLFESDASKPPRPNGTSNLKAINVNKKKRGE